MNDTKETRVLLSELIAGMCAGFGKQMDEVILAKYSAVLLPRGEDEIRYAFAVLDRCPPPEIVRKNWATPADIIKLIDTRNGGTVEQRTAAAWAKVVDAVRRSGRYCGAIVFDDPAIHVAVAGLGGWVALCNKTLEEFSTWTAKAFALEYVTALQYCHAVVPQLRGEPGYNGTMFIGPGARRLAEKYSLAYSADSFPLLASTEPAKIGDLVKLAAKRENK